MEGSDQTTTYMTKPRATHSHVIYRVKMVVSWIAQRKRRAEILELARQDGWDVSDAAIDVYIRKAKEEIQAIASKDRPLAYVEAALDLDYLYAKAVQSEDGALALAVRREMNKLYGLYPTTNKDSAAPAEVGPAREEAIRAKVRQIVGSRRSSPVKPIDSDYEEI